MGQSSKKKQIFVCKDGNLYRSQGFLEALRLDRKNEGTRNGAPVISLVGAGGKTSVIRALAKEYAHVGIPVAVTTTTHLMMEELPWFLLEPSVEKMENILRKYGQVWVGTSAERGRMTGVPEPFFRWMLGRGIPVLVEADGSRRLPVKAPGPEEPVIPKESTHVLALYGLDGIGLPFQEACFRPEVACRLTNKRKMDLIQPNDISVLAGHSHGGRKGCPPQAEYTVVLNKADTEEMLVLAAQIGTQLEQRGSGQVLVASNTG